MPDFTTRVELHEARPSDYDVLHDAMEAEGFSRQITADDGVTYRLPTAEYIISGAYRRAEVMEKARRAASKTGKRYSILVTESAGWTLFGLEEA